MNVREALAAINNNKHGTQLKAMRNASMKASRLQTAHFESVEKSLKPHVSRVKSYIRRRLKRCKCFPQFEGRGWYIDFRSGETKFALSASVAIGCADSTVMKISFEIRGLTLADLDRQLIAVSDAAEAVRARKGGQILGVVG